MAPSAAESPLCASRNPPLTVRTASRVSCAPATFAQTAKGRLDERTVRRIHERLAPLDHGDVQGVQQTHIIGTRALWGQDFECRAL